MRRISIAILVTLCAAAPAFAIGYPVSGAWGESQDTKPGAIDCQGRRIVTFESERRFDSGGGVRDFRKREILTTGEAAYRITEEFNTGQINAQLTYRLRQTDNDHLELTMSPGGTLKLQRCK